MNLPKKITAGDTVKWSRELDDYPAGDGWKATYVFSNQGAHKAVEGTPNGDSFDFVLSKADTGEWSQGTFNWWLQIEDAGQTERTSIEAGLLLVAPNATSAADYRSQVKRSLDNINAVLEKTASKEQESYVVEGMELKRRSVSDLIKLKNYFEALYQGELAKAGLKNKRKRGTLARFPNV